MSDAAAPASSGSVRKYFKDQRGQITIVGPEDCHAVSTTTIQQYPGGIAEPRPLELSSLPSDPEDRVSPHRRSGACAPEIERHRPASNSSPPAQKTTPEAHSGRLQRAIQKQSPDARPTTFTTTKRHARKLKRADRAHPLVVGSQSESGGVREPTKFAERSPSQSVERVIPPAAIGTK